jgi:putative transposase
MVKIFKEAGESNSRNKYYQFWQQDNEPKEIFTKQFALQKLEYIHNNPVEAGVEKAEEYVYSSAKDYYYGKQCGLIPIEFLL